MKETRASYTHTDLDRVCSIVWALDLSVSVFKWAMLQSETNELTLNCASIQTDDGEFVNFNTQTRQASDTHTHTHNEMNSKRSTDNLYIDKCMCVFFADW